MLTHLNGSLIPILKMVHFWLSAAFFRCDVLYEIYCFFCMKLYNSNMSTLLCSIGDVEPP